MKKSLKLLPIFVFVLFTFKSISQPIVSFTASTTEACAPAEITFTNTTTGCVGNATYYWLDGTGDNSNNENPTFFYSTGGTYTVSLSVTCDGITNTNTMTINIYDPPISAFNEVNQTGCIGYNTNFIDESTSGDGAINNWQWYFGDGNTSTSQSPAHTYTSDGVFSVSLIVTDENNCSDEHTASNLISIAKPPQIDFSAEDRFWCVAPHNVDFNSQITTSFGLSYSAVWDFGDGSPTETGNSVNHEYVSEGLYNVSLNVTDAYGCTNSLTKDEFVQISLITPQYSVLEGDVVCKNMPTHFQNETTYSCKWDFGDGSPPSYNPTPEHVYTNSGDYEVTFTIDPEGVCETSTTFTLTVENITASFTTNPTDLYSCIVPFEVEFLSTTSSNVTGYYWSFDDGGSSTEINPIHTYNASGVYHPSLTVTTNNNCAYTYIQPTVTINVPDASFTASEIEGCAPLTVEFDYNGTTPTANIVNYSWDFNNGETLAIGGAHETATFEEGEYTVTLTITDDQSCVGISTVDISVGSPYEPNIDVFDNDDDHTPLADHEICAQDTLALWLSEWDLEDYEFTWLIDSSHNEEASEEYTEYLFDQDTGWVYINMITMYNGCRDTILWDSLYILGPIIKSISYDTDCSSPLDFVFSINEIEAENWDWEFYYIDGGAISPVESAIGSTSDTYSITFPNFQEYWCKVTAYNSNGCEYVDSLPVNISSPQAIFSLVNDEACAGAVQILNGGSSQNVEEYYWDFGDGNNSGWTSQSVVQHSWIGVGMFTVTLTVRDANGCESSVTDDIHILGPNIDIDVSDDYGCNTLDVTFTDLSTADEPIVQVMWDFNDGNQLTGSSVEYTFDQIGSHSVTVYVQTSSGCLMDTTYQDLITVATVDAEFSVDKQIACVDDEISFVAEDTSDTYLYIWSIGEGSDITGNEYNITHSYTSGGKYDIKLIVNNNQGCTDTLLKPQYIIIEEPQANFSLVDNVLPCYPAEPEIIQNSSVVPPDTNLSYEWIMGNNDTLDVEVPQVLYFSPDTYDIVLNVTTPNGCSDTYTQQLLVEGPTAEMSISDNNVCLGDSISFEILNMNDVVNFSWVVGGGNSYNDTAFLHAYDIVPVNGYYIVNLSITSGTLCTVNIKDTVWVHNVNAEILITDLDSIPIIEGKCPPFEAILHSNSEGETSRTWFVDGDEYGTGVIESISIDSIYEEDVTINIAIAIENDFGCRDTATANIDVYKTPKVQIHNDTTICNGEEISLFANGGTEYQWTPNNYISDVNISNPIVSPSENITYTVDVYNEHLCKSTDSVFIEVIIEPEITLTPEIDTILIGDSVYSVLVADQENLNYTWTPSVDISCNDCPMPIFFPKEDTRYILTVEDSLQCFKMDYYVDIYVREEYSLDVPKAFTPLGDESNRIVYVRGFGIKKLLQFRIYNRWGEEVFFSDDINKGWDGYFKGQIQNIDTYSYFVEVEMYNGSIKTKKGNILLMR